MPIALYVRVSTEDQAREGFSLQNQEEACRSFALQKFGKDIEIAIYRDVESGFSTTRKDYLRLLKDCELGKVSAVIVWRLDRLSRNTAAGLAALQSITESWSIPVHSVQEQEVDFANPENKLMNTVRLGMSEYERNRLKARVMPGMKKGVEMGHYQGARYPFWGLHYDKPNKRVTWVESEKEAILKLFKGVADGLSLHSMAKRFYAQGYRNRNGRPFTITFLAKAIKREIYCDGFLRWNGLVSQQPILKPFVDRQTWERANAVVASHTRKGKVGGYRRDDSSYILHGVLKCERCGGNLIGHLTKNRRYYTCSDRFSRTDLSCKGQWLKADAIEPLAYQILKTVLSSPIMVAMAKENAAQNIYESNPQLLSAIRLAERHIRELKTTHKRILKMHLDGHLSLARFSEQEKENEAQELHAKNQIAELKKKLEQQRDSSSSLKRIYSVIEDFDRVYSAMDYKSRKTLFNAVFLKLIGESVGYKDSDKRIKAYDLREPFKTILKQLKGGEKPCNLMKTPQVLEESKEGMRSSPTAGRRVLITDTIDAVANLVSHTAAKLS